MFHNGFDFSGMHGMGGRVRTKKEVNTTKLYEILGLSKEAEPAEIKKAYRKMAMVHHPDKGGSEEKFKEVSKAYEILHNPEKRKIYDEHGEEGLEANADGNNGSSIFDIFDGMRGAHGGMRQKKKADDIILNLNLKLEEFYSGCSKKVEVKKNTLCIKCKGAGGANVKECTNCKGRGLINKISRMGPVIQQTQALCSSCNGRGKKCTREDECKQCKGKGISKITELLDANVAAGKADGDTLIYENCGNQAVDVETGKVVIVLKQLKHSLFVRAKNNLCLKKTITLYEALTGFMFTVDHLDHRRLVIRSNEGSVIKPGDYKMIRGEGMPSARNISIRGNMIVEFDVVFPSPRSLTEQNIQVLKSVLPNPEPELLAAEEKKATFVDPSSLSTGAGADIKTGKAQMDKDKIKSKNNGKYKDNKKVEPKSSDPFEDVDENEAIGTDKTLPRTIEEARLEDVDINALPRSRDQGHKDQEDNEEDSDSHQQTQCKTQ